jgi:hypothetical protein
VAADKVLLVEGPNDAHLVWNLLDMHGCTLEVRTRNRFEVLPVGGLTGVQRSLRVPGDEERGDDAALRLSIQIRNREVRRVGVVVDADVNPQGRWDSVRNALRGLGYDEVPERLEAGGFVAPEPADDRPRVGVWIMPDNLLPGMVEDFAKQLRPPEDRLWTRAEQVVADIPEADRLFPPGHGSKAIIHTWLAWQAEPGKPIGQAIKARYLLPEAEPARQWMDWFQRLFDFDMNA